MFFYNYQCCIRKNNITQDIPTYPSDDEENATISDLAQKDKDPDAPGSSTGQWFVYFLSSIQLRPNL